MKMPEFAVKRRATKNSEWFLSPIKMTEQEIQQQNTIAGWRKVQKATDDD